MKQRLLVMNGQKVLQAEQGGEWKNQKVDKAGLLKPGIYNLYLAQQADKSKHHDGIVVFADTNSIFQQVGKSFTVHARSDFDRLPEIGTFKAISYDSQGKGCVVAATLTKGRSR